MIIRKTTDADSKRVNELFAIAFEQPMQEEPAIPMEEGIHTWAAFTDDGKNMMSTVSISDYDIQFDGNVCKMGGVGGVATLPQYRRHGGIRGCFEAFLPDMYRSGYDFSYLYPFSTGYYRRFGFENCVQKYAVTVNLGLLNPPKAAGTFVLAEKVAPLTPEIRSVDQVWEKKYNMMVQHKQDFYGWTKKVSPAVKQEFTYVYMDEAGEAKAYTTFRMANQPDGRNLVCSRFVFADREGFLGLMNLFKSLASDHLLLKFTVPNTTAMQYLMPEWSMGAATWSVQPAGMVRVINVKSVLEKARYLGDGQAVLEITDKHIPENNGQFRITFQGGKAVSVEKTESTPDAVLPISTFSALISGVSNLSEAKLWMDGQFSENPALEQVFYPKPLMIADYF